MQRRLEELEGGRVEEGMQTLMAETTPVDHPPFRVLNAIACANLNEGRTAVAVELSRQNREDGADIARTAAAWAEAGADALAVHTDEFYTTDGAEDVRQVARAAPGVPILALDWTLHPVQVVDAMRSGAVAVQVVAQIMPESGIGALSQLISRGGVDMVVECVNVSDVEKATAAGASLFGMNLTVGLKLASIPGAKESVLHGMLTSLPPDTFSVVGVNSVDALQRAKADGASCVVLQPALLEEQRLAGLPHKDIVMSARIPHSNKDR